jgi:release factor glutamine methyltransferase
MSQTGSLLLRDAVLQLRPVLGQDAARDARVLLAHALGIGADRLTLVLPDPVPVDAAAKFQRYIQARLNRCPVSQIIGRRLFWGREFLVTGDVLDPRPETETLIALALEGKKPQTILDLGLGSGCILLSLLAEFPHAAGVGVDVSLAACAVAVRNAEKLNLLARADIRQSDWYENVSGKFDLVVSNPPYITESEMAELAPEVAKWEPEMALTPGGDGLAAYRVLAQGLSQVLAPEGVALFEFGHKQGLDVTAIFAAAGFDNLQLFDDMNGHGRIIRVQG